MSKAPTLCTGLPQTGEEAADRRVGGDGLSGGTDVETPAAARGPASCRDPRLGWFV